MEDLFYAGGLPAVLKELIDLLHKDVYYGKWKNDC